jgi:hypothetical protein
LRGVEGGREGGREREREREREKRDFAVPWCDKRSGRTLMIESLQMPKKKICITICLLSPREVRVKMVLSGRPLPRGDCV